MNYSKYQQDIFDHIKSSSNSLVISALAGSGKTTSIVESLSFIPKNQSILMLAFNKSVADELKTRVPSNVNVKTFNGLGASSLYSVIGPSKLNYNKIKDIALEINSKYSPSLFNAITLVNYARTFGLLPEGVVGKPILEDVTESWEYIIDHYNMELGSNESYVIELARKILIRSINMVSKQKIIDFDDQIYIPVIKNLPMTRYDFVFVDEAQDTSEMQIKMIQKSKTKETGRVIAIGDRNQAIYGFRGASSKAFDTIMTQFKCDVLPLSVSYRCGKEIVKEANKIVPAMLPRENANDGIVRSLSSWDYSDIKPSSMILCRNNAPLFDMAYYLIKNNKSCKVLGKDISKNLIQLIKELNGNSISDLANKLTTWENKKISDLIRKKKDYLIESVKDKPSCIRTVMKNSKAKTIKDLIAEIELLFADNDKPDVISLSSCHRSKGLESDVVYFLDSSLIPSKYAKMDWELEQEQNLKYVAITRAKNELVYIDSFDRG